MYRRSSTMLGVSLIALLMILSTAAAASHAPSYVSSDVEDSDANDPPGDIDPDPIVPDPGNMTTKIGGFGGTIEEPVGSFTSFEINESGISNHHLTVAEDQQICLFEEISVEEFGRYKEKVIGHTYLLKGNAAEFRLYDNPSTMLRLDVYSFEESGREVSFRLGDMEVEKRREGMVSLSNGDYSADLISLDSSDPGRHDPGERDDFREENDGFINFTVEDSSTFIFRMDMDGFEDEISDFVREKMRIGRIGAEFRIESTEEGHAQKHFTYRDINMKSQMRDEKNLEILVSSEHEEGTLMLLDISSSIMDIESKDDIELRFDGEPASFEEDVDSVDESDGPSYTLIHGEEGTHILVNVPYFSTHSITVEYLTAPAETVEQYLGSLTYYIPTAVVTAGLVLVGLLNRGFDKRSKKKKKEDKKVPMDDRLKDDDTEEGVENTQESD